jgi:hypothetical protein
LGNDSGLGRHPLFNGLLPPDAIDQRLAKRTLANCLLPDEHNLDKAAHRGEVLIPAALNPGTAS